MSMLRHTMGRRLAAVIVLFGLFGCTLITQRPATPTPLPPASPPPPPSATVRPSATPAPTATRVPPTRTPRPTRTLPPVGATPSTQPSTTTPLPPGVIFSDDFSDAQRSPWSLRETEDYTIAIQDGQMVMTMRRAEWAAWTTTGDTADDFVLDVDSTWVDGPADNDFGVVLRLTVNSQTDEEEFYTFSINSLGEYSFWLRANGDWTALIDWTESPALSQDQGAVNHLQVIARGEDFTFLVNGEEIDHFSDATFSEGEFGLYVASTQQLEPTVAFDNFVVSEVSHAKAPSR
jgi:hypothetical protein